MSCLYKQEGQVDLRERLGAASFPLRLPDAFQTLKLCFDVGQKPTAMQHFSDSQPV